MAKHSKKKIVFSFVDTLEAEEFLKLVERKKMYVNLSAQLNASGKVELTLTGSPENIKITMDKLKKLRKSLAVPDTAVIPSKSSKKDIELKLKLKKLKFEET
jgi:hypothetical protein